MKAKTIATLILLSGSLVTIVATVARPRPQEKADQLSENEVLGLMRTINTAQVVSGFLCVNSVCEEPSGPGFSQPDSSIDHYQSLDELVSRIRHVNSSEAWQPTLQIIDSSAGRLKDYKVSVVVSPDRRHYVAQLIRSSDCGLALFSNETGVIYTATALGCPMRNSEDKGN
jgi:hypothetical protein